MFSWRCQIRGGAETDQHNNILDISSLVSVGSQRDKWVWSFDHLCQFSVISARRVIDVHRLPQGGMPTRWNRFVPIKINVLMWRVLLDHLPVKTKLE